MLWESQRQVSVLCDEWWPNVVLRKSQTAVDVCVTGDEPVLYWESHRQLLIFVWQVTNPCCTEKVTDSCWCLHDMYQPSVVLKKPHSCWCLCDRWWTSVVLRKSDSCQCLHEVWQPSVTLRKSGTASYQSWCDGWQPGVVLKKSETAVSICMTGDDPVLYWESHSQLSVFAWWVMTWYHLEKVRQLWGFAWQVTTQCCLETVGGRWVSSKREEHWPVMQGVSSGVLGQAQTWPTGRARHRCVHPPLFTLQLLLPVEKKTLQISRFQLLCTPKFPAFFTSKVPQSNSCF